MMTLPVLLNVIIVLFPNFFVSATDFYWIAAGNTCYKTLGVEHSCLHYSNCLSYKNTGHVELCNFDGLKSILCCVKNDELESDDETDVHQQFPLLDDNPAKLTGIYPWDVSTADWEKDWDYKSNSAISPGYDFELSTHDWTKSLFDGRLPTSFNLPKIHTVYGVPTTSPGGLDVSNRARGPDGRELPPDTFGARITDGAEGLNIQKPFYKPTIENSTSLRMCSNYSSYFRPKRQTLVTMTIVRGVDAEVKQFPHLALLGYGDPDNINWACGGTLISDQYVLTAAHCIYSKRLGDVRYVRLGEYDLNRTSDNLFVKEFTIADTIIHPLYNFLSDYHDIGLVRLNRSVNFNVFVYPACLATTRDLENVELSIAGWGRTEVNAPPASVLQTAALKLVAHDRCRGIYRTPRTLRDGILEDIHICADGGTERSDACHGDSGGPLQFTNNDYVNEGVPSFFEVAGIVSFGHSCGLIPGVYTRVLPYVQWIENIVWPS